jgi:NADPH-dependent glutamate synthase beta subunit-like oxidoreductase
VVVIGGGNVAYDVARTVVRQIAYDAARTAARLPDTAGVTLVSLEGLEEMPADTVEIVEGDEEGIARLNGWGPVEIERDGEGGVRAVVLRRCTRVYDEARRFAPVFDDGERLNATRCRFGRPTPVTSFEEGGADISWPGRSWPRVDRNARHVRAGRVRV